MTDVCGFGFVMGGSAANLRTCPYSRVTLFTGYMQAKPGFPSGEFAAWFKEQLRLEKESPEGHKIDQLVVLAHLTQLQFASTIPQSKKTNNEQCLWPDGTTKQEITLDLIKELIDPNFSFCA